MVAILPQQTGRGRSKAISTCSVFPGRRSGDLSTSAPGNCRSNAFLRCDPLGRRLPDDLGLDLEALDPLNPRFALADLADKGSDILGGRYRHTHQE